MPRTHVYVCSLALLVSACSESTSEGDRDAGSDERPSDGASSDGDEGDGRPSDGTGDGSDDGSTGDGDGDGRDGSGDGADADGASDGSFGDGEDDRPPPGPDDPADGPGASARLTGVWNQDFDFAMSDYPLSWAISTVHASMLFRQDGIDYSPSAVLAIAIKESAMKCDNPSPANAQEQMAVKDGCFQLEAESAYPQLRQIFPERFAADHADVISGVHFPSAAITTFYYGLFSLARFRDYRGQAGDPQAFFDMHPDRQAAQKVLCGAYNRGLWWTQLTHIFRDCRTREVTECFGGHAIAIDHALKIADYTRQLEATAPFDAQLSEADLLAYWDSIKALYPDANASAARAALSEGFAQYRGDQSTVSFHRRIRQILQKLIDALPPVPTQDQAAAALCEKGQLSAGNCN